MTEGPIAALWEQEAQPGRQNHVSRKVAKKQTECSALTPKACDVFQLVMRQKKKPQQNKTTPFSVFSFTEFIG